MKDPKGMTVLEVVEELTAYKDQLNAMMPRIHELAESLIYRARRNMMGEDSGAYLKFGNVWTRFSGVTHRGLDLTRHGDRILKKAMGPTPGAGRPEGTVRAEPVRTIKSKPENPVEQLLRMYRDGV